MSYLGRMTQAQESTIPPFTIHDRCRKAREFARLDQDELANRIYVSRQTISNYETAAVHALKPLVLRQWAMACGVDTDWLLEGSPTASVGTLLWGSDLLTRAA